MAPSKIVTHPGPAHKDDFLACSLLLHHHPVPIYRREPDEGDLADTSTFVVDVGGQHDPSLGNFDHHQFPADHPPVCALTLVLQHLEIYDDARKFCEWIEPAEHFDTRGPIATASWLGLTRQHLAQLNSPIDGAILRAFARLEVLHPGDPIWELMKLIGSDTLTYVRKLRGRLADIGHHSRWLDLPNGKLALFLPRIDPAPADPSLGIGRYIEDQPFSDRVIATIYPDRRGNGYALSRFNDCQLLDFTAIREERDVHFAHNRGFVAKTSATELPRLEELLLQALQLQV